MTDQQLLNRIVLDPKVMAGKPVILGTRLTVEYVLNLLAHGATFSEILDEYDGLTTQDIQACLLFATKSLSETEFMPLNLETALTCGFWLMSAQAPSVARWLGNQGHEVFSVYDQARGIQDDDILQKAIDEKWILITNDKDFGKKVFRERRLHHGIIFMRLADERASNKIEVLRRLLDSHASRILDQYIVVTEKRVRFAKV